MKPPSRAIERRLRAARGFVFDMDGTLVLGDNLNKGLKPLSGAIALTRLLRERGIPFVLLTNGTTRTPAQYAATLREIGFEVDDDRILTPSAVAAEYFARRGVKRVYVLGGPGVYQPLADAGVGIVRPDSPPGDSAEAIFVGWHREFCMNDLERACHLVWGGAALFTSSLAPFFATATGKALGTSRAICAMITSLTGRRARILGKPSREALRCAGRRLGIETRELAVVGDDPELEIPMALRAGSLAIAVHTGVAGAAGFAGLARDRRPDLSFSGVDALLERLA